MPDFSGLPLVIEPSDLLGRLDADQLILVDLTSAARYAEGHIPGAHFVDPKRTQLGQPPAPGLLPNKADLENCSASWATPRTRPTWSTTTKAVAGPDVSSGCST